jgi:hypothetical protein
MLAYLLTNQRENEDRLWRSLETTLSKTTEAATSNAGTQGRTLLNNLEVLSLDEDSKQKDKLRSSGFDIKKQRRLAGKLFSLYGGMFKLSKQPIGSTPTVSGQSEFFLPEPEPEFALYDKADLAFKHLISYWKLLPTKEALLTGKKDRAFSVLQHLVDMAHKLKIAEKDKLYEKLKKMGLPEECLELFPCSKKPAKSFYSPMQAAPSSPPAPN